MEVLGVVRMRLFAGQSVTGAFVVSVANEKYVRVYGLAMHFYLLADPLHIYVGH